MTIPSGCILALDLGTTAFKAAPVSSRGLAVAPVVVPYTLDYAAGRVTCEPERYFTAAIAALKQAAHAAVQAGSRIDAIGISSQAQTYLALNRAGASLGDAVVWTDNRAVQEAEELNNIFPNPAALCGFRRFSGQQFLPKVVHYLREEPGLRERADKFLLLNEYIAYRLTGMAFGDETNQGMGGFFDITNRSWSAQALEWAGITAEQLAFAAPAAHKSAPLLPDICRALEQDSVPVYLCGNDQTCALAGLEGEDSVLCNFGTAMVVCTRKETLPDTITDTQIAGIDPLTSRYFLLGFESECGNVLEWLTGLLYPGQGVGEMLKQAARAEGNHAELPRISLPGGGLLNIMGLSVGSRPEILARSLLEYYADRFMILLRELDIPVSGTKRLIASGGLARSPEWLDFLSRKANLSFIRAQSEHSGLIGIERIIARNRPGFPPPSTE